MIKKFSQFIGEALIHTYNIIDNIDIFKSQLNKIGIVYTIDIINKLNFTITIDNMTQENYIQILDIIKFFGYFPSHIIENVTRTVHNMNKEIILKNKPSNYKWKLNNSVKIIVEANYEDKSYNTVKCPDTLYHLTYDKNVENILKLGLYPKSKSKITDHNERIYLFKDLQDLPNLLLALQKYESSKIIKSSDSILKFSLLEIDCSLNKLVLHTDPNYLNGYYTYNNINKSNIKVLQTNL